MAELTSIVTSEDITDDLNTPYYLFRFSIRTECTRKYYERRIKKFFDFLDFSVEVTLDKRFDLFAQKGKLDNNWAAVWHNQILAL